jgi:outer membrane lipoprotein-sorting protein
MKKHILPVVFSLLVTSAVTPAAPQTVDQVIEKHLAAMGGREALGKLTSRKSTGTITIELPNGTIGGPVELYSKAPNKARAYMSLDLSAMGLNDKMTLDQKFDGTSGWVLDSLQGDRQITGNQLDNMKNGEFPNPLLNLKANGTKVELLPSETVAGKAAIVLRVTPKIGSVAKVYLDAETMLAIRTVASVNMPEQGGDVETVAEASDYRTVDGVKVPFKTVNTTATQTVTMVIATVQHNVAMDDAMFSVK